jgi:hypothetical protein
MEVSYWIDSNSLSTDDKDYFDIIKGVISISSLLLYLIIIVGVTKKVFPFLVVLFFILLGFAHAFFIVLRSEDLFSEPSIIDNIYNNS